MLTHDATRFADQMGIDLYETSAKENKNVEEVGLFFFQHNYIYSQLSLKQTLAELEIHLYSLCSWI